MDSVQPMSESVTENRKWWTLLAVCIATFMLLLDVTIVNVALDSIEEDLDATFADLQWVVDAYALTLASFLLTFGSISDIFGRRRMFLAGIALFTVASLGCALATDPLMLNIARGVQGIGAAAMFATALALIGQEFHGKERGTAFGLWGATTGAAVAVGPVIGGALTHGIGWEWIFLVNIPVGVVAFALTAWKVPSHSGKRHVVRVDVAGLLTFSIGLFLLIFGLVRGNLDGWGSGRIVFCLFGSVALLVSFVVIELRSKSPMLDMSLFKVPTFVGASVAAFGLSASIFALFLYITLYFQNVLQYDPLQTGIRFLPVTVLSFVVAAMAGKASAHLPVKGLMGVGLLCVGIGLAMMGAMVSTTSGLDAILPGLCVCGFGIGLTNPPLASTAVGVVSPERGGMAGGINSTFRQVGIATGIAGLGAVFQHRVESRVLDSLSNALEPPDAQQIAQSITNGSTDQAIASLPTEAVKAVATRALADGFVNAFQTILYMGAAVALVSAIVVLITVRTKDFPTTSPQH